MPPQEIEDPVLGRLEFHPIADAYEGEFEIEGVAVPFVLDDVMRDPNLETRLQRARQFHGNRERYVDAARRYTVVQLLGLKNESWLRPGEPPLTAEEFRASLRLSEITFHLNGETTFFLEEGESIWGHVIMTTMDESGRFLDADTPERYA